MLSLISTPLLARDNDAPIQFVGGSITLEALAKAYDDVNPNDPMLPTLFREYSQSVNLDYNFNAGIMAGSFRVNGYIDAAKSNFVHRLGDRLNPAAGDEKGKQLQIYNFQASHFNDAYDLNFFYHVPRYHWGDEGDFFALLDEATDMPGMDKWNDKAPMGAEFVGKEALDGLKVVLGDQISWGAEPQLLAKYQFGDNKQYTAMLQHNKEDARKIALSGSFKLPTGSDLIIGGIVSGNEHIGDSYDYIENGVSQTGTIESKDTFGIRSRLTHQIGSVKYYGALEYAGLVADAGEQLKKFGSELPYSELGNKKVLELGAEIIHGNYFITPRVMVRDNIHAANTAPLGLRNTNDDPFVVTGNRQVDAAEIYLTFDPTPGTHFYEWNNNVLEDAKFAYNIGLTYTDFKGSTDSFLNDDDNPIGSAIAAEQLWLLKSRMMFNTSHDIKAELKLEAGKQQNNKTSGDPIEYSVVEVNLVHKQQNIYSLSFAKDKWGGEDYHRDFGTTYPEQVSFGYERLLDAGKSPEQSSKVGFKGFYRSLDANSGSDWVSSGDDYQQMNELQAYFTYQF